MKSLLLLMLAVPLVWTGVARAEIDNMSQNEMDDLIEAPESSTSTAVEVTSTNAYVNPINAPAGDFSIRSAGFDDKADAEIDVDHEIGDALFESSTASLSTTTPEPSDYVSPFRSAPDSSSIAGARVERVKMRRAPASHKAKKHKLAKRGKKKHGVAKLHRKHRKHGRAVAKGKPHKKGQHRLAGGKFSSRKSYR